METRSSCASVQVFPLLEKDGTRIHSAKPAIEIVLLYEVRDIEQVPTVGLWVTFPKNAPRHSLPLPALATDKAPRARSTMTSVHLSITNESRYPERIKGMEHSFEL